MPGYLKPPVTSLKFEKVTLLCAVAVCLGLNAWHFILNRDQKEGLKARGEAGGWKLCLNIVKDSGLMEEKLKAYCLPGCHRWTLNSWRAL